MLRLIILTFKKTIGKYREISLSAIFVVHCFI